MLKAITFDELKKDANQAELTKTYTVNKINSVQDKSCAQILDTTLTPANGIPISNFKK